MFKVWFSKFRWIIILAIILCLFTTSCSGFNVKKVKEKFVQIYNEQAEEDIKIEDVLIFGKYGEGYVVQYKYREYLHQQDLLGTLTTVYYDLDRVGTFKMVLRASCFYFINDEIYDFFAPKPHSQELWGQYLYYYYCFPYIMGYITYDDLQDINARLGELGYIERDYDTVIKNCNHNVKCKIDKESTCLERGIISYYCTKCDKVLRKENLKLKHHNIIDEKCTMCNGKTYECLEEDTDITNSINETADSCYKYRYMGGIKYNGSDIYIYDLVEYWNDEYIYKNKTHSYTPSHKYNNYEFVLKSGGYSLSEVKDGIVSARISVDDSMAIYQLYKQYYENMNMEEPYTNSGYEEKLQLEYFSLIYPLRENRISAYDFLGYYDGLYVYLSNYYLHLHFAENDFSCEINGYKFEFETNEQIYVYDGENNITLKEAWDKKLITEEQLSLIYDKSLKASVWG